MKTRKTPISIDEIAKGIRKTKAFARADLKAIHLLQCDFEVACRNPLLCDITEQSDGRMMTVFKGRLIEIRSAENPLS